MEQQKPLFYFHARRGSRCSSCVSTRTTRKRQAQRVGHNQQIFHKDKFCFSLLILHSAYLTSCLHRVKRRLPSQLKRTDFAMTKHQQSFPLLPICLTPYNWPLNRIFTDAGQWAKWKTHWNLHLPNQSSNQTPQKDSTNATRGSASKDWAFMHRHRAQRYRIEFISNRRGIPILYTRICFSQGGELVITWSLVTHMSFYCCLGTLHQAVSMKPSSCDSAHEKKSPIQH